MQKDKFFVSNILFRIGQVTVVIFAALFILFGAVRGEVGIVLKKAVRICMECIGIG